MTEGGRVEYQGAVIMERTNKVFSSGDPVVFYRPAHQHFRRLTLFVVLGCVIVAALAQAWYFGLVAVGHTRVLLPTSAELQEKALSAKAVAAAEKVSLSPPALSTAASRQRRLHPPPAAVAEDSADDDKGRLPDPLEPPPSNHAADSDSRSGGDAAAAEGRLVLDTEPLPPGATVKHLAAVMAILSSEAKVDELHATRAALRRSPAATADKLFLDRGSRAIDQTTLFFEKYPGAAGFAEVHCFEANPQFNSLYPDFVSRTGHAQLRHHNLAVGVTNTTMTLSNRNIGSSLIYGHGKGGQQPGGAGADITVPVFDFAEFLRRRAARAAHVVVKMDIEGMEYAVLHRLLRTGTSQTITELLLECHHNTNKPKAQRDPTLHIGKEDCTALVEGLRKVIPTVVLWNSRKTARRSMPSYIPSHGGFSPT